PSTVCGYVVHLFKHHKSTLIANDIYLLCSCGFEIRSCYSTTKHNKECDGRLFSLQQLEVKKDEPKKAPIKEKTFTTTTTPTTPQCILCEPGSRGKYPKTALSYAIHLKSYHNSSLIDNGIYLICKCGMEVRHEIRNPTTARWCNGDQFTLHQ
ncbi:hypothetical protein PENTCL1PPCAC_13379, partial [Pristionchus entomophagus]